MKYRNIKTINIIIVTMFFSFVATSTTSAEEATSTSDIVDVIMITSVDSPVASSTLPTDAIAATTSSSTPTETPAETNTESPPTSIPVEEPVDIPPVVEQPIINNDTNPPGKISDLKVERVSSKSLIVAWTVPKDDSGKISGYDIRLSRKPIDNNNFNSAISFSGTPGENTPGAKDKMEFSQLPEGTILYVAIKAMDKSGNLSKISNVIQTMTKNQSFSENEIVNSNFVNPGEAVDTYNSAALQSMDVPVLYGTVKTVVVMPNGTPSMFPVYVNYINGSTGLSYGGPSVNGFASYKIPAGDYYVRLVVTDSAYREPKTPIMFHLDGDEEKDLGNIMLENADSNDNSALLLAAADTKGGMSKILVVIINMLGEILQAIQKIAAKLNV